MKATFLINRLLSLGILVAVVALVLLTPLSDRGVIGGQATFCLGFILLFGYYLAFTAYVVLRATEHDALPAFSGVMLAFVIPLTLVTLGIVSWRNLRRSRAAH